MNLQINDILNVSIGAIIALVGTIVTSVANYYTSKKHEQNNNLIIQEELDNKIDIQEREYKNNLNINRIEFENKLIMNNREYIPDALKKIMAAVVDLYNVTEQLVVNFPGSSLTGKKPGLMFEKSITGTSLGIPDSYDDLVKLDQNFRKTMKNFDNVLGENLVFISVDIKNNLKSFREDCTDIKQYFYGRYTDLNEEKFQKLKEEVNNRDINTYLKNSGVAESTYQILNCYEELSKRKEDLEESITQYLVKTTNMGENIK